MWSVPKCIGYLITEHLQGARINFIQVMKMRTNPQAEQDVRDLALNWSAPECNRVSEYRAPCKVGAKSNTRLGSSWDAEVTIFESVSSSNSYSRSRVDRIVCRGTRNSDLRAEKILSEKWFFKDRKVPRITESSTNDTSKQYQRC